MKKLKVFFCGTPQCAVPALELLSQMNNIEVSLVVTMPDRPAGRGRQLTPPPIALFANQHRLPILQSENINRDAQFADLLQRHKPDAIIVFAFAQFLNKAILSAPRLGCFNIHTSLLPKYRGAAPIQYALLNGDKKTGVTIQRMVAKMDAGDIALSEAISIDSSDNTSTLTHKLQLTAMSLLSRFIEKLQNDDIQYTEQDHRIATFAPTLKKEFGHLLFQNLSCEEIQNRARALFPWPGIFCFINNKRLKIIEVEKSSLALSPGQVSTRYDLLTVGCKDGSLHLKSIQLEGKKCCCDKDFINGFRNIIPEVLP